MSDWHLTGKETLVQLLNLSHNDRRRIREAAQAAVLQCPREKVIPALVSRLADERPKVQNAALDMLVRLDAREAIPDLLRTFAGTEPAHARYHALLALDRLRAVEVRPLLARAAQEDADPGIRQVAAGMLGKNADQPSPNNTQDEQAVLDTLRKGEPASCWGACDAVLALRPAGAVPLLLGLLSAPHPGLQVKVIYTLARLGAGEAIPQLRHMLLSSASADVIAAAADGLEMLADPEAVPRLLAALERMNACAQRLGASPSRWTLCDHARWSIVGALGDLRAVAALPQILPLLLDPEDRLWRKVRDVVLRIGDSGAVELLAAFEQQLTLASAQAGLVRRVTKLRRDLQRGLRVPDEGASKGV